MLKFVKRGTPTWVEDVNGNVGIETRGGQVRGLVTSTTSGSGIEIEDGSATRSFLTAEMASGVPTGNFS